MINAASIIVNNNYCFNHRRGTITVTRSMPARYDSRSYLVNVDERRFDRSDNPATPWIRHKFNNYPCAGGPSVPRLVLTEHR